MCIYCRNRGHRHQAIAKRHLEHIRFTDSETDSVSSFSSIDSADSPELCQKHKHKIVHKVHFPTQQMFMKHGSPDNNLYRTNGFLSSPRAQKAEETQPQFKTNFILQNEVYRLKKEMLLKDDLIQDLTKDNKELILTIQLMKESQSFQVKQLLQQVKIIKNQNNPIVKRQNKKIDILLHQFQKLKNKNNQKLQQVENRIFKIGSNNQAIKMAFSPRKSQKVKQIVVEEERYIRWKDNFIRSFLDMIQKLWSKQGVKFDKRTDLKKRTKQAWRYLKQLFRYPFQ